MRRGVLSASVIVFRHERVPWACVGKPERTIGAAILLTSRERKYLIGLTIFVDGGFTH